MAANDTSLLGVVPQDAGSCAWTAILSCIYPRDSLEEKDGIFQASLEGSAHKAKENCITSTKFI